MKIHCTRLKGFKYPVWERDFVGVARKELRAAGSPYEIVERPEEADLIIVLESNADKTYRDIARYEREPLVRLHGDRLFTINYEPTPAGFLPGLYTGLTPAVFNPNRHRGWAYLFPPLHSRFLLSPDSVEPTLLFSFRGARSHPVRERLLTLTFQSGHPFRITHMDRWFNHTEDETVSYVQEILASHFVLCPRGLSPSSHRCYEVMALGRCPVIIADDWIPPRGIDWETCSVRVAEADIDRLPEILTRLLPEAPVMGAAARAAWQHSFGYDRRFVSAVNELVDLQRSRPVEHDERLERRYWRSKEFYTVNHWTLRERLARPFQRLFKSMSPG